MRGPSKGRSLWSGTSSWHRLLAVPLSSPLGQKLGQGRASSLRVLVPHLLALRSVMYCEVLINWMVAKIQQETQDFQEGSPGKDLTLSSPLNSLSIWDSHSEAS